MIFLIISYLFYSTKLLNIQFYYLLFCSTYFFSIFIFFIFLVKAKQKIKVRRVKSIALDVLFKSIYKNMLF